MKNFVAAIDVIAAELAIELDLDLAVCTNYVLHHLDEWAPLDKYKSVSKR